MARIIIDSDALEAVLTIVQTGVINPVMTRLSAGGSDTLHEMTNHLLDTLGHENKTREIVQPGAIHPLVTLLRIDGSDTVNAMVINLIGTLAIENHTSAIVEAGAIAPLIALSANGTDAIKQKAAELLSVLTGHVNATIEQVPHMNDYTRV